MSAAQVKLRGVTKAFPSGAGGGVVHALGPIDIEIRKGEFFAIVGPSGCGKSTLLELIAGLTLPTEGKIEFEGRAIKENVPDGVGVVFQDDESKIQDFLNQRGSAYPTLIDEGGRTAIAYGVGGVPETFFLDKTGRIVAKYSGALTPELLEKYVAEVTGK